MSKVIKFYPPNSAKNPDYVLEQAAGNYESLLILGYDKNGVLDARASLNLDHETINWILDRFKHKLLHGDYDVG